MNRQITLPDPAIFGNTLDYGAFIKDHVQPNLVQVSHGQPHHNEGAIIFPGGSYELDAPLIVHPLNSLIGETGCSWTYAPSTGIRPSNEWTRGEYITKRELPAPGRDFANFCATVSNLNFKCVSPDGKVRVNGPHETLSQQSRIERCKSWGYGAGRAGWTINGDVWRMIDCIADRDTQGQRLPPKGDGSAGFLSGTRQLRKVSLVNCTSHNNDTGVQIHYACDGSIDLESETTRVPFRLTGNACGLDVHLSCQHHHGCIAHIAAAKEGNFSIRIHGTAEFGRHCIVLPDGREEWVHPFANSKTPRVKARARSAHTRGAIEFDVRIWRDGRELKVEPALNF